MRGRAVAPLLAVTLVACLPPRSRPPRFGSLVADDRPYHVVHGVEVLTADNGLTIALRPDARTNLVSVDVRYLVGGAEDPRDRSGMAHLVEHLTFALRAQTGGPTLQDELAEASLYFNAWTTADETHYTTIALADQLSAVLAIEARRMQPTCDQLDEALFRRERDVVIAEESWRRTPQSDLRTELARAIWGRTHPYSRSAGDVQVADATREEACAFVDAHYAPDRAILVVTGRFDERAVRTEISRRFATIERKATGARAAIAAKELGGRTAHVADVDEATAIIVFRGPRRGDRQQATHAIVASMLGRALRDLDDREAWITGADVQGFGGGRWALSAAVVSVADPARLDDAIDRVFAAAAALRDPGEDAVAAWRAQVRTTILAAHDAFAGAGAWIADYLQYTEHGWFFLEDLSALDRVTPKDVARHAARVLARTRTHVAKVRPSGRDATARRAEVTGPRHEHDLQPWHAPIDPAEAERPLEATTTRIARRVEEHRVANGMRVLLAPDPDSALVEARLVFPHGSATDPSDRPGVALATASVIANDTDRLYTKRQARLLRWAMQLGTQLTVDVRERSTTFVARGNAPFADWHVWRLFWLLDAGIFPERELAALHARARAARADRRDEPATLAARLLAERLHGDGHPHARPPTEPADMLAISARDLQRFRAAHYRAAGAVLIVSGGFDAAEMRREVDELFGPWSAAEGTPPPAEVASRPRGPSWLGVVDPEAAQVHVTIAFATVTEPVDDAAARAVLAMILDDRARVVREGLGASYGVSVEYLETGALAITSDVEPDRAGKALAALVDAVEAVRGGIDAGDFVRARRRALAAALADPAGASELAAELERLATRALPLSFPDEHVAAIAALTPDAVAKAAAADLAEARMVVVVRGPRDALTRALAATGATAEIYSSAAE